jgi:hypothetical protein
MGQVSGDRNACEQKKVASFNLRKIEPMEAQDVQDEQHHRGKEVGHYVTNENWQARKE